MTIEIPSEAPGRWLQALAVLLVVGSGVTSGVFFAFSTFVMAALARLPSWQGLSAMNAISVTAVNPLFMLALFGTALGCLAIIPMSLREASGLPALCLIAAALIYVLAVPGVTMVANVPLNDGLAVFDSTRQDIDVVWPGYLRDWGFWNHVRTVGGLVSTTLFALALVRLK